MIEFRPLNSLANLLPSGLVTLDSRKATSGVLFIAASGATSSSRNGHDFISQAIQNGCCGLIVEQAPLPIPAHIPVWQVKNSRIAAAILSEQAHSNPSRDLNLCGVTGTNGKTTVSFLVACMAKAFGRKSGVLGTLGAGSLSHLEYFGYTTPEAENLSAYLADLKKRNFEQIAMEVSSHALATHRVDGLCFKAAAFTNLSQDHLDFHGTLENYARAKARLFEELLNPQASAILPYDYLIKAHRVLTWGSNPKADIQASNLRFTHTGIEFLLRIENQSLEVQSPLFGRFNIDNMLCAAGLAYATGISLEAIALGLHKAIVPKGRLERVSPEKPAIFVDFAHTPDALDKTLETLREICAGKLILVFGCGGDRDRSKRLLMTQIAQRRADRVYVTLDNPRHEAPEQIIHDMSPTQDMRVILDRKSAILEAIDNANPDDIVVIAGKGHETTQQIGDEYHPFDDAQIAREVLLNRHPNPSTR